MRLKATAPTWPSFRERDSARITAAFGAIRMNVWPGLLIRTEALNIFLFQVKTRSDIISDALSGMVDHEIQCALVQLL